MKPISAVIGSTPTATLTTHENGSQTVRTTCRECDANLVLPCQDDLGQPLDVEGDWRRFALQWADMLVCNRCHSIYEQERSEEGARDQLADRVKDSRMPESFRGLKFEDMRRDGNVRDKAIAAAWAWADTPPHASAGVLLHGPSGTGKTRLAGTAVWRRLHRWPVAWVSVAHLIAQLQASFSDSDRREAVRTLTGAGALVLDDLDKVRASEWVLSQLFVAIDRRVNAGAPLLVTTNVSPGGLDERFGQAITSRLLGYCRPFEMGGPDIRVAVSDRKEGP